LQQKGANAPWNPDDEITVERRVRVPATAADAEVPTRRTTQMTKVDSRLLAIARGEIDPDEVDPFGGLIPIYDDEPPPIDVDDDWLILEPEPEPELGPPSTDILFAHIRPHLRLRADEVMVLPVGDRTAFFVSQIDGQRTVKELADVCAMDDLEALEIMDELLRMGAVDLR
jgi:hypothetical protein